jgi:hypothetical protein
MQLARGVAQVLAREREANHVRRATRELGHRARREQASERLLLRFQRALLQAAARADAADLLARFARRTLLRLERAVGARNGDLGGAQRLARLAPVGFAALELGSQRVDSRAQRGKILFPCCCER